MRRTKVLIAYAHPALGQGLTRILSDEKDIEVVATTTDGQETVTKARELKPDVALIDLNMPTLDGIEIAKQLKAASPDTRTIILSEYDYGLHILPSLRAGALGYLLKTCSLNELINAIHSVHSGKEALDPKAVTDVLRHFATFYDVEIKRPGDLNKRELEVLKLAAKGMRNPDIARRLVISERTVQTHLTNIFRKLGVSSRVQAIAYSLKRGWLTFDDLS